MLTWKWNQNDECVGTDKLQRDTQCGIFCYPFSILVLIEESRKTNHDIGNKQLLTKMKIRSLRNLVTSWSTVHLMEIDRGMLYLV